MTSRRCTFLLVDIVGATEVTTRLGNDAAKRLIGERLDELARLFVAADPSAERRPAETGDALVMIGTRTAALVLAAVSTQARWRRAPQGQGLPVRIALGEGEL